MRQSMMRPNFQQGTTVIIFRMSGPAHAVAVSESSTTSGADVAAAAQRFGQQDDICVISVTRTAVSEPALA